ncbi:MAG: hypothetical protein VYD54_04475 [Bdellovibrionota bacterium]|nr:hypothetical protein [Bdellovibrionota bacterium]
MNNFTTKDKVALLLNLIRNCKVDDERGMNEIKKTAEAFISTLLSEGKIQNVGEIVSLLRTKFPRP